MKYRSKRNNQPLTADQKITNQYVNDKIKAFTVRVVDENGELVGEMPRSKALELAGQREMDLVQIAYDRDAKLCTAKLVDMGKFFYDKKKKEKVKKEQQKQQSKGSKEIKISYAIGANDLQLKIDKAQEMLEEGYTVRVFVQLKGRENMYATKAIEKLTLFQKSLEPITKTAGIPKGDRNVYSVVMMPSGKKMPKKEVDEKGNE